MQLHFGKFWLLTALLCLSGIGLGNRLMLADAWVARGNYHNDAHPGKCAITETLIISPGESVKSPSQCAQIHCGNAEGDARIVGCGSVGAPDGCKWGDYVDKNAPFQQCCARHLICDGGLNNETQRLQEHIWGMFAPKLKNVGIQGAAETKE
ncbi:uncharacterized protein LOC118748234 [Rhagoletis pomonella]|uniref:uncharacterized protein LOC118748234 n=1 Tax=Rhagoletis pomonella TaxID=28610 RepID=UPI00177B27D8|nr:uncharacterized protein LOC118748234 [Rhagoletis pomonella]